MRGREVDRVNRGRLGPKGLHGWRANTSPDRITKPLIRSGTGYREANWDEAMDLIVSKSKELIDQHSGSSIGFYTPLIALGGFSLTWRDMGVLAAGILLVALLREGLRRPRQQDT